MGSSVTRITLSHSVAPMRKHTHALLRRRTSTSKASFTCMAVMDICLVGKRTCEDFVLASNLQGTQLAIHKSSRQQTVAQVKSKLNDSVLVTPEGVKDNAAHSPTSRVTHSKRIRVQKQAKLASNSQFNVAKVGKLSELNSNW
jgi:hypothetical protein